MKKFHELKYLSDITDIRIVPMRTVYSNNYLHITCFILYYLY